VNGDFRINFSDDRFLFTVPIETTNEGLKIFLKTVKFVFLCEASLSSGAEMADFPPDEPPF